MSARRRPSVQEETHARIGAVLDEFGLTESTAGALWALGSDAPPQTMRELARTLRCDPSNVTLRGDKLEAAGLLLRQRDPGDGRARRLVLTDAGDVLRVRMLARLIELTPVSTLTAAEQRRLSDLLAKLGAQP